MLENISWRDIGALLAAGTATGSVVIVWVRWQLSGAFAGREDIAALSRRVEAVEERIRASPTHSDIKALSDRVASVERGVDVAGAELRGVREGVGRIELDLRLLLQHHIKGGI